VFISGQPALTLRPTVDIAVNIGGTKLTDTASAMLIRHFGL
jgi:hypothetical protein